MRTLAVAALVAFLPQGAPKDAAWKEVQGVRVPVPPAEHPRLYLRAKHLPDLAARLNHPVLKPVAEGLKQLAAKDPQVRVEWDALQYLVTRNREAGLAAAADALDLLQKAKLPDVHDACRVTGRWMVTGAIAYDWLHPLLTKDQKDAFVKELVRLAKTLECGYPPAGQGSVTGHSSEAMIMRDLLSAGIAVYDEFPEMYDLAAGRFFREHLPARNWFYPGNAHHQGDAYGVYRFSWDLVPLWIFDRLGAGNVFNPEQRNVPYYFLYTRRPDGQRFRSGDCYLGGTRKGQPWGVGAAALMAASYYGDGYLLHEHLRQPGGIDKDRLFELLWRDPALQPRPPDDLPLSRHFGPPFGWTVARTGWGENAAVAEMKVNVYNFTNHQHLDAGAFQFYYRGALAVDSGLYQGSAGGYGSPHDQNYHWRTIAHNSLLVHDPKEVFGRDWGNDGGQRLPNNRREPATLEVLLDPKNGYQTGEVLAQGCGPDAKVPDYTYLTGDLTRAYSSKVRQVVRSFVFLNLKNPAVPAALVVFDRVVAADPSFRKYWLMHTLEEPQVEGNTASVEREKGCLSLTALLPPAENQELSKVGGPGKEFWVFGKNYPTEPTQKDLAQRTYEPGAWRLELSPRKPSEGDFFLVVMQVSERGTNARLPVKLAEEGDQVGCAVGEKKVLFSRASGRAVSVLGRPVR